MSLLRRLFTCQHTQSTMKPHSCLTITPYHLALRMAAAGVKEIPGKDKTNWLIAAMNWMAFSKANEDDPWCGSLMHFTHWLLGFETPRDPGGARNWLTVGKTVRIEDAQEGDVVVLWREDPKSWKGHVGYFQTWAGSNVRLLGGNQGDAVSVASFARTRILGVRRPVAVFDVNAALTRLTPSGTGVTEV